MTKDTGGPAFPKEHTKLGPATTVMDGSAGMTLRDWFAGQAVSGMGLVAQTNHEEAAINAFLMADAMLRQR